MCDMWWIAGVVKAFIEFQSELRKKSHFKSDRMSEIDYHVTQSRTCTRIVCQLICMRFPESQTANQIYLWKYSKRDSVTKCQCEWQNMYQPWTYWFLDLFHFITVEKKCQKFAILIERSDQFSIIALDMSYEFNFNIWVVRIKSKSGTNE